MTTIIQSPPTFQSLQRLGWDGPNSSQGGFPAMSSEDVSRIFMPQRKVVTRSSSSSSLASNSSNSSTSTVMSPNDSAPTATTEVPMPQKKKQRGGFWPVSKSESTSSVSNARANGAVQPAASTNMNTLSQKSGLQPAMPDTAPTSSANGVRNGPQNTALLILLPMNGTFERKQINVPMQPDPPQKIGRQTNNKTTPKLDNGYFDSKVLSRQHAEIWADNTGRVWIRDVKSSNGTFVNGQRLSPENRESEPHELRQHDSLELGIDIVSEDQKTVVHHKVSAKVEFVGFPGRTGNALDILSFGELDPSQGHSLMNSPMSSPMAHSRSQPGRPVNGRTSTATNVGGGNINNVAQRQVSYWGTPLNIEQLVKQVGVEMRAAKQQAQDLEQARSSLTAILSTDGSPAKPMQRINGKDNNQQSKVANGRVKPPRADHPARFTDPPAPPPQQPLPEKPDSAKPTVSALSPVSSMLKRENTAKALVNGANATPPSPQSSQILSLIETLNETKRQLESQGSKVRELEDMLRQERQAREAAEDKIKRLEETKNSQPIAQEEKSVATEQPSGSEDPESSPQDQQKESELQQRIELMLSEMQIMQQNLEQTTQRAETAESEKSSLAEMIEKYRKQSQGIKEPDALQNHEVEEVSSTGEPTAEGQQNGIIRDGRQANGHIRGPKIPEQLQQAVAMALQHQNQSGEVPVQYAPFVSMMGVVLIGVGVMAYLNSWQKVDK